MASNILPQSPGRRRKRISAATTVACPSDCPLFKRFLKSVTDDYSSFRIEDCKLAAIDWMDLLSGIEKMEVMTIVMDRRKEELRANREAQ